MVFWHVVGDITILLGVAVLLGIIAERVGLSSVVGYLLAGTLVGPGLLNWVTSDEETIRSIAEIGVALLLFTIGLEVNGQRLKQLAHRGMFVGILQIITTGVIGMVVASVLGCSGSTSIIIGAMAALSSTAVVARVLQDRSELDSEHGRLTFSILLVQDFAIVPLMILVGLLGDSSEENTIAMQLGTASANLIALVVILLLVGILILPRIFGAALLKRSHELPVIVALVTCFSAIWLSHYLNLSPALGAFVAGLILAGSPFAAQVRGDMAPLKHIFLTLFFVSIGMLADLPWLFTGYHWVWAISIAIAIVFGKCIIVWIVGMVCKHPLRVSIATGLCLAQIGEFSFVLGAEGLKNGLIKEDQFQLMMSASLLTLLISPLLISKARPITKRISAIFGGTPTLDNEDELVNLRDHIIVLGYGVAGKEVVGELLKSGNQVLVIDIGPNCVRRAKEDGAEVILGNAQRREVLVHARVQHAKLLISTLPDQRASSDSIQHIRAFVPTLKIIARVRYSLYVKQLYSAGADIVVDEESCVGQTLALQSLEQLGQLKKL